MQIIIHLLKLIIILIIINIFFKGDIISEETVSNVLQNYQIDTIMHFAAQTHVGNI